MYSMRKRGIKMKAMLVNGSPRPNGCTYTALVNWQKHWSRKE